MTKRKRNRLLAVIIGLAVVLGLLFFPTKYYVEIPGGSDKLSQFIKVAGKKDQEKGSYRLMTVGIVGPASPALLIWGHFQPFSEIVSKSDLMGESTSAEYTALQNFYIKSAANSAVVAAMTQADKPVQTTYKGIYVMSIMKKSQFAQDLKLGDTITAVNGHHYKRSADYIKAISQYQAGKRVTITFVRNGQTKTATRKLIHLSGTKRAGLGITLTDHTEVTSSPKVKIDAGSIGGPSAGLMFALQVYDQVSDVDLRQGRTVAGTGTITDNGTVGVIGGIDKKVYAAAKSGATIFFAPDVPATKAILKADPSYVNNYVEAKRAAKKLNTKMKIVPVRKLSDAINYLKETGK